MLPHRPDDQNTNLKLWSRSSWDLPLAWNFW